MISEAPLSRLRLFFLLLHQTLYLAQWCYIVDVLIFLSMDINSNLRCKIFSQPCKWLIKTFCFLFCIRYEFSIFPLIASWVFLALHLPYYIPKITRTLCILQLSFPTLCVLHNSYSSYIHNSYSQSAESDQIVNCKYPTGWHT